MPEKFLRLLEVRSRVPYSRSSLYRLIALGEFPAPFALGARAVAWREADIDDWIRARIESGQALSATQKANRK